MAVLAYVNGEYGPIDKAVVSVEDRGYQFGDAVYEVIASRRGRMFLVEQHLDRLERSMQALSLAGFSREHMREAVDELFRRSGLSRAAVYIQVSRGVAQRVHSFPEATKPQVVMTVREVTERPAAVREQGAAAVTVADLRWGRCDIKSVQLLPNVLAKQKANESGAEDAIFVSDKGIVREATSSNVFIVQEGTVITHPTDRRILAGITRGVIIDICCDMSLPLEERYYDKQEMLRADEVFLTGTTTDVLSVVRIDGKIIGQGKMGAIAAKLRNQLVERN